MERIRRMRAAGAAAFCIICVLFCAPAFGQSSGEDKSAENLFPYNFKELDDEGMPVGWNIRKAGEAAEEAVVSSIKDEDGEVVMKVEIPKEASVFLDPVKSFEMDPAHNYLAVIQLKAEDINHLGNWYNDQQGVRIWLQARDKTHTWLAVYGEGSTDGWVTGYLPFPTGGEEKRQNFHRINIYLRCLKMTGTVYFKSPVIVKLPEGYEVNRSFEREDGTKIEKAFLQATR